MVELTQKRRIMILVALGLVSILGIGSAIFVLSGFENRIQYLMNSSWTLEIELPNGTLTEYSTPDLISMEYVEDYYFLWRGGGEKEDEQGIFRGVSIQYLLDEVLNIQNYSIVTVQAIDSYASSLTALEIENEERLIIAYMIDGHYISGPKNGGDGPLRLIIPQKFDQDLNALRCVKFVNKLIIHE